ncbi:MAG: drug/metabolite transporter (DMT)-like permease [Myxococcota bacterium]|jgi:drug/metabolite transporter (DMT)-like permease
MYQNLSAKSQGILWAIITCFLISVMIALVRHLANDFHPAQIVMMRNLFALIFLLPFIAHNILQIVRTKHLKMHLIRGFVGLVGMLMWFYTITLIPLSEAVAITFIVPITTTIAAIVFLKEEVNKKIWISLFIGFIGVLIIVRPGFREFHFGYLFALVTPFVWSISNIMTKKLVKTETPGTITFYLSLIIFILSVPISVPYLTPIVSTDLIWFVVLGIISNGCYMASAICYSKTDLSAVQPFDFSRLLFTSIIAYFFFEEQIDLLTFLGATIILLGSIIATNKSPLYYLYSGFSEGSAIPKSRSFFLNMSSKISKILRWKK